MLWDSLTAANFEKAVEACEGVCVLPIGVIEKHGNHLPLGTDMHIATSIAEGAAELEKAIVFPYYFMGQIAEARHYPGTVAISHQLMMQVLREICDEIARNGCKKIFILNAHGGNNHFLPFFAQEQPGVDRDYCVYIRNAGWCTDEQGKALAAQVGCDYENWGAHAGFKESSMIMHLHPELVKPAEQPAHEGESLNRLPHLEKHGIYTGFNWYADFPYHFAGDFSTATAEAGKIFYDAAIKDVAEAIRAIKKDDVSLRLAKEYINYGNNPTNKITH